MRLGERGKKRQRRRRRQDGGDGKGGRLLAGCSAACCSGSCTRGEGARARTEEQSGIQLHTLDGSGARQQRQQQCSSPHGALVWRREAAGAIWERMRAALASGCMRRRGGCGSVHSGDGPVAGNPRRRVPLPASR